MGSWSNRALNIGSKVRRRHPPSQRGGRGHLKAKQRGDPAQAVADGHRSHPGRQKVVPELDAVLAGQLRQERGAADLFEHLHHTSGHGDGLG
jgi:hypothetical protein